MKLSFTGNTATGHAIRQMASGTDKELTLELGGSDPMIVMPDADIKKAVEGAVRGRFYNAGQTCTAVKRVFVHEKVADEFQRILENRIASLIVGNGLGPHTDMGPLISVAQRDRIAGLVEDLRSREEGHIACGGCAITGKAYENGNFYRPTLVTDVSPSSRLLTEEVFGPVLPVVAVLDLDRAIDEANNTRYGLGASVWTRDLETVRRVFDEVHAGIIWVNRHLTVPPEIPFGGMKESGTGRENGYRALEGYTRTKTLFLGR